MDKSKVKGFRRRKRSVLPPIKGVNSNSLSLLIVGKDENACTFDRKMSL